MVKNKDFTVVNEKVKKLGKKAYEITKMQEFQIGQEDDFSATQINNSSKIVSMTIIQIVLVILIGCWQIYSLKKYFKSKSY